MISPVRKGLNRIRRFNNHFTTDAYLIGYPKCGNTWLRVMLGRYIQEVFNSDELTLFGESDRFGRCKRWAPALPRIQFTHGHLSWAHQTSQDLSLNNTVTPYVNKRAALLVRSIPDVLSSMFAQWAHRSVPPYRGSISDFIRDPRFGMEKIITWYNLWPIKRAPSCAFSL